MLLPPDVIEKIKKERDQQERQRSPLHPEITPSKDRLETPDEKNRSKRRKGPLIIELA